MVDVDRSVVARIKKIGKHFEILVDCDQAIEYKEGKNTSLDDVLASKGIFTNVKKGERANDQDLTEAFKTTDENIIADVILKHGEIQLTTKHREAEREQTKKRIIDIIHQNAVDSKTGYPHPRPRIEQALEESSFKLDEHKTAEDQIDNALKALRSLLPISFEKKHVEVTVPAQYAGQAKGVIHKHTLIKEHWLDDGSYMAVVEIPAGIMDELFDTLNAISHGNVGSKILKTTN